MQSKNRLWIWAGVAFFLLCVFFQFPYDRLKDSLLDRIYKETRVSIIAKHMAPAIFGWPGVSFDETTVTLPPNMSGASFSAEDMTMKVGLGGLFPPRLKYHMHLSSLAEGGDLSFSISDTSKSTSFGFYGDDVNLKQFNLTMGNLSGILQSNTSMNISKTSPASSTGKFILNIEEFVIPAQEFQYATLPMLNLGNLDVQIQINNGIGEIKKFSFQGRKNAIQGTMTGEIRLGRSWMDTHLKITLNVTTSLELAQDPNSATLMSLLKPYPGTEPNTYSLSWDASIREMQMNPIKALPQRALN